MNYKPELFHPSTKNIFVFGSNNAGRHGAGAAKFALQYCGAKYGVGRGIWGNSFAIPTKDVALNVLPLPVIQQNIQYFIAFASAHPDLIFFVTAVGTGLAGYSHLQIAPMFSMVPPNCLLPTEWNFELKNGVKNEKEKRTEKLKTIPESGTPSEETAKFENFVDKSS